jgi:transcriptional regulator with XRE-family HTH domain
MNNDAKPLSAVIGENLQVLRQEHGRNQDDVATSARRFGLRWTRATVAALETGRRSLDLGEYLLLPLILHGALGVEVDVSTLVPATSTVQLGPDAFATGRAVRAAMTGRVTDVDLTELRTPRTVEWTRTLKAAGEKMSAAKRIWPKAKPVDLVNAEMDSDQVVERRAAERLGVSSFEVAVAARRLWNRSMTEERDRRLAAAGTMSGTSAKAYAGHVTRQLTEELRPVVISAKEA